MKRMICLMAFCGVAFFVSGCATSTVKTYNSLGDNTQHGYVEFYVGVTYPTSCVAFFTEFDIDVSRASSNGNESCGKATCQRYWGTRLRVACPVGTNEFILTQTHRLDVRKKVKIDVKKDKVTPVRILANVMSTERSSYATRINYSLAVRLGSPTPYYNLATKNYRYKDGRRFLGLASFVTSVLIEGKDMQEVIEIQSQLDRAHEGLNLGYPKDHDEFVRRYYMNRPKGDIPRGTMVRIDTVFADSPILLID